MRELTSSTSKTVPFQKVVAHVHALAIRRLRAASRYITMRKLAVRPARAVAPLKVAAHAVALVAPTF